MHIGIFAERFQGCYGADRVLVILGELLQERGHQVTLVGVRFSPATLERFPGQTIRVPDFSAFRPEPRTLRFVQDSAYFWRRRLPAFDACVVGGYPFITAIPYLRTLAPQVIFLDFGVVPTYGYHGRTARLIEGVRAHRRRCLKDATQIVAISDFIAEDQSRSDCQDRVPVSVVLLGADHLIGNFGCTEKGSPGKEPTSYRAGVPEDLKGADRKLVLLLGRWEPGCYKNSQAAFDVLRSLLEYEPNAALLVMARPDGFRVEPSLESNVFCIGLPSDAELFELMGMVDAGISVSLWEGFNLPIVEMQALGKQALAFRLAAHPEVVVAPEQLCADGEDMAMKLLQTFEADGPPAWTAPAILGPWREKFSWRRFGEDFCRIMGRAA